VTPKYCGANCCDCDGRQDQGSQNKKRIHILSPMHLRVQRLELLRHCSFLSENYSFDGAITGAGCSSTQWNTRCQSILSKTGAERGNQFGPGLPHSPRAAAPGTAREGHRPDNLRIDGSWMGHVSWSRPGAPSRSMWNAGVNALFTRGVASRASTTLAAFSCLAAAIS
jgi:hypothetical protein